MSTNIEQLADFLKNHQPVTVITGAGCSAASGIPTYRDDQGTWLRSEPIQHSEFMAHPVKRQRYWTRSYAGWPYVQKAQPNESHHALARLEQLGYINQLVTQNVDRLHQKAGQRRVIDLHGRLDLVHCTECYTDFSRDDIQQELAHLNPHLTAENGGIAPDGDADVPDSQVGKMQVPDCARCGGIIKPSVVFYGGGVNKQIVEGIYQEMGRSEGVLVVGSSLMVFSSFRFCRFASKNQLPIAILNPGQTRADELTTLKLPLSAEQVLPKLIQTLEVNHSRDTQHSS